MAMQQMRTKGAAAAAVLGLGAMLTACSRDVAGTQFAAAAQGAPVAVSCEPNQRAVVRQEGKREIGTGQLERVHRVGGSMNLVWPGCTHSAAAR